MSKNRNKNIQIKMAVSIVLVLAGLVLLIAFLLEGKNVALFHSRGMIAHEQLRLMLVTVGLLLVIAVPTLILLFSTAWKYRESNGKAARDPNVRYSKLLNVGMWLIPSIFMALLALVMWPATHRLEPQKPIVADTKPLTVQVVSLPWKWLFIYPDQNIATVNHLQIPAHTPVRLELTADELPMSSFWIPNLAGMLYSMTGHSNTLNLIGDTLGDYPGSSAEINGAGFAGMKFTARVSSEEDFSRWVDAARDSGSPLDAAAYEKLLKPSENHPTILYSAAESGMYDKVLMKYMDPSGSEGHMHHGAHHE
jgi:cytochrome o ubiquinol oxidase subunit II